MMRIAPTDVVVAQLNDLLAIKSVQLERSEQQRAQFCAELEHRTAEVSPVPALQT